MSLTIVTGLPGAAKTLYTLSELVPEFKGRLIFIHDINGIDHEYFGSVELEDAEKWYEVPDGSAVIIDEAWKHFPTRGASHAVPEKCTRINEHRHRGIDIVLITQAVTDIDVHMRRKCDRHIHMRRIMNTESSNAFEWPEVQAEPLKAIGSSRSTKIWPFCKKTYPHYKSAELHTMKRRIPKKMYIAIALILAAVAMGYFAVKTVAGFFDDEQRSPDPRQQEQRERVRPPGEEAPRLAYAEQFVPEVEGLPWSAPIYQEIQKAAAWPKPHCILFEKSPSQSVTVTNCRCYTQQATRMEGVPLEVCAELAQHGFFDWTRPDMAGSGGPRSGPDRPGPGDRLGSSMMGE